MTTVRQIPSESASVEPLKSKTVAVLGYGAQGHAHALNLRDSGLSVIVAQRSGSPRAQRAIDDGFEPVDVASAVQRADLLIFALPDDRIPGIFDREIRPHLAHGQTLGFLHGFVLTYGLISPPRDVDVILVAPKAQGHGVRRAFADGGGVLSLIAVQQDATGHARDIALAWAAGIGSHRAGLLETTARDETETDLFGEQAVLCGGLTALIKAGFETLVEAGYPPELAYFECCHELKLLTDLIHAGGITHMRERISSTARFGDVTRGGRVIGPETRKLMREVLDEIQSGRFAEEFLADASQGNQLARELTERDRHHALEQAGAKMRALLAGGG